MTKILGLKITHHDTGAALIAGTRIVAISEERLNRIKHSRNTFPKLSIDYCLNAAGIKPREIDYIFIDQLMQRDDFPVEKMFREWDTAGHFARAKIHIVNHHDAHASSAFFCSPFKESAVLVYDGHGEVTINQFGVPAAETETFYYGSENTLTELQKTTHARVEGKRLYTSGIGGLYTKLCRYYLNFGPFNEGKMMGLAGYGDDRILKIFPPHRWFREYKKNIFCNVDIMYPPPLS